MAKLKILIAEDDKTTQAIYRHGFSEKLFDKQIASDGAEALDVYNKWNPDVILLDFKMPIYNGYQVLKEIREKNKDKDTTIIMVTGVSDKTEIIACAQKGIQGYIIKPFMLGELEPKVCQIYNEHKASK